jgi:hypothetical protein
MPAQGNLGGSLSRWEKHGVHNATKTQPLQQQPRVDGITIWLEHLDNAVPDQDNILALIDNSGMAPYEECHTALIRASSFSMDTVYYSTTGSVKYYASTWRVPVTTVTVTGSTTSSTTTLQGVRA